MKIKSRKAGEWMTHGIKVKNVEYIINLLSKKRRGVRGMVKEQKCRKETKGR